MESIPTANTDILNLSNIITVPRILILCLIIILISIISLYLIHIKKSKLEKEFYLLMCDFEQLNDELLQLDQTVTDQRTASKVNLPANIIPILDIYENSNIKLPVDVLEEVIRMSKRLDSDKMVFDYIENQRLFWKHENSKKPYKKVK